MDDKKADVSMELGDLPSGQLKTGIYEKLKTAILTQEVLPSVALNETTLANQYQVSRTPVREALHELVREGLIQRNGRFYQVKTFSQLEIRHLYELREALECMAVQLCIDRGTDESLNKLDDLLQQQVKALDERDMQRLITLDSLFHLSMAKMTGNEALYESLELTHNKVMLVRGQVVAVTPTWSDGVIVEHERILSAITRRDKAVADAEMRYHLNSVVRLHLGIQQAPLAQISKF